MVRAAGLFTRPRRPLIHPLWADQTRMVRPSDVGVNDRFGTREFSDAEKGLSGRRYAEAKLVEIDENLIREELTALVSRDNRAVPSRPLGLGRCGVRPG